MSRYDNIVSAEAWNRLVSDYEHCGGEDASDRDLAEILRLAMIETEG